MVGDLPEGISYVPKPGGPESYYPMGRAGAPVRMTAFDAYRAVECAAIAAQAEARGEPEIGIRSVVWTVINRSRTDGFEHPCAVVTKAAQYQGLDAEPYHSYVRAMAASRPVKRYAVGDGADASAMMTARRAVYFAMTGGDTDPTNGATHFITQEGASEKSSSHWANTFRRLASYGGHIFMSHPADVSNQVVIASGAVTVGPTAASAQSGNTPSGVAAVLLAAVTGHQVTHSGPAADEEARIALAPTPSPNVAVAAAPSSIAAMLLAALDFHPVSAPSSGAGASAHTAPAPVQVAAAKVAAPAPAQVAAAKVAAPAPVQVAAAKVETPAPAPVQVATNGAVLLHLASYRTDRFIDNGWRQLVQQFPDALAGASQHTEIVNLPGKGQFTRLFAVLPEGVSPSGACHAIKAHGGWCETIRT